jgi:hypothetical protein
VPPHRGSDDRVIEISRHDCGAKPLCPDIGICEQSSVHADAACWLGIVQTMPVLGLLMAASPTQSLPTI